MAKKTVEETTVDAPVKEKVDKKAPKLTVEFETAKEYLFDPADIVVDHEANSRVSLHTEEDVEAMAKSYEEEGKKGQHGQLQPIVVRIDEDGKPNLVAGYKRYTAAIAYNKAHTDKPMKLRATLVKRTDEEAFLTDIKTNLLSTTTTPVDDWKNQCKLRDQMEWTNAKIAKFYGQHPSYVSQLQKIGELTDDARERLHKGEIGFSLARDLATLPYKDQDEVLVIAVAMAEEAWGKDKKNKDKEFDGKVDTATVVRAYRRWQEPPATEETEEKTDTKVEASKDAPKEEETPAPKPPKAKDKPRTLAEVKAFFNENAAEDSKESDAMKRLGRIMADLFAGKGEVMLLKRINALLDGEDEPEVKKKPKKELATV